jgi:hypothetical protein
MDIPDVVEAVIGHLRERLGDSGIVSTGDSAGGD